VWRREKAAADSPLRRRTAPHNNALKLTKRGILSVGATSDAGLLAVLERRWSTR
jgi:hypothetical protein